MDIYNLTEGELNLIDMLIGMKEGRILDITGHPYRKQLIEAGMALIDTGLLRDVFEKELEFGNSEFKTLRVQEAPPSFLPPLFGSSNRFKDNKSIKKPEATQEYINYILLLIQQAKDKLEDDIPF